MTKLIKQAQRGSKEAFVRLMEQNKVSLTRAAKAVLKNDDDVADAVAETVLTAAQKINSLNKAEYFKTWLTRILLNHCYQILREQKHIVSIDAVAEAAHYENPDLAMDVRETLLALHENDRLILTLFYMDDLSVKSIAKILHISENAVKTRLSRGRARFQKAYEKREEEFHEACQNGYTI